LRQPLRAAHHQEISVSQRIGKNNMQVAFYSDSIVDPVLTGVGANDAGEMMAESGDLLPDIYSGTFSYQGNNFATRGMRVVLQRKLLSDLTATLDYAYGGVLDLSRPRRPTAGRTSVDSRRAAPGCGGEVQRNFAQGEDALDRLLSLRRRPRFDPGRPVQYFGRPG
jgi:hypothetical protein